MSVTRRAFLNHAFATGAAAAACVFASDLLTAELSATAPTAPTAKMITRKIPSTGEALSALGLGTYNPTNPRDLTDEKLAPLAEVFQIFYDAGGRVVDTAPSYGTAEQFV